MANLAPEAALEWAATVLGSGQLAVVRGLRAGGSPWLVAAPGTTAVLRAGQAGEERWFATAAAALRLAASAGLPVPRVLGTDTGAAVGVPLLLTEYLPGVSQIPRDGEDSRLRRLGEIAARIHATGCEPSDLLPLRDRPIGSVDFARLRREQGASPVLREAERIGATKLCGERTGFAHGDLWLGNILWDGGTISGILDWDMAGVGPAGVDIGSLRCDAALYYGAAGADEILAGWEEQAGRAAGNVAYWDMVAALSTPPDMGYFAEAIAGQGRPDLDPEVLIERRDAFLRRALDRLG